MTQVRVRIAPSPTGYLHLGTARTAIYNYLFAKKNSGKFILRLEDTDEVRSDEIYTQDILKYLKWLNINWDEGPDIGGPYPPYRQSEKIQHYQDFAKKLISSGHAYYCYASTEELQELKENQIKLGQAPRYDNRGRFLSKEQIEQYQKDNVIPCIRLKIDDNKTITFNDLIKGEISISVSDLGGDPILVKSSGMATYNFAVVVDDIDMDISHVIRGEDHIHNTAKQILVYEALGCKPPYFGHPALIFDSNRQKLSKRKHGEFVHISKYAKDGYLPQAIFNYLTHMSFSPKSNNEIFDQAEAIAEFDLSLLSKSSAVFDIKKLNWFNNYYIKKLDFNDFKNLVQDFIDKSKLSIYKDSEISKMLEIAKDGLEYLGQINNSLSVYDPNLELDLEDSQIFEVIQNPLTIKVLSLVKPVLSELTKLEPPEVKKRIDLLAQENYIKKGKDFFMPIRLALTFNLHGPDLSKLITIIPLELLEKRLNKIEALCLSKAT